MAINMTTALRSVTNAIFKQADRDSIFGTVQAATESGHAADATESKDGQQS
jgi:hypothetical protein